MPSIPYLSLNRASGIFGLGLLAFGLVWLFFGIDYIVNGVGWDGGSFGKVTWIVLGVCIIILSLGVTGLGGGLTFFNSLVRRRENRGEKDLKQELVRFFDLNRIEGALAIPLIGASPVFLINGIVFYIISKVLFDPQNQILKRAAREFKGAATWFFVIMFALWVAAGICLFINRYYVMQYEDWEKDRRTRENRGAPAKKEEAPKPRKEDKPKKSEKTGEKKKTKTPPPPPPED